MLLVVFVVLFDALVVFLVWLGGVVVFLDCFVFQVGSFWGVV